VRDQGTRRARAACRFSQTANAFGCGPRRHLPSALRRTGATRSGLAFQLPATDRTKKLVRVSPAETSHYERRRRNAADHVSRSSLGARLVQADAGAGQGFRHLQCGSRKALPAAGDNRPARAGGDFRAQIHLTLVIRRASANRNLNGRFWESREAAAGRNCPFDGEPASGQKLPFAQAAGNPLERSPECRSRIRGRPTIALVTKRAFGPSTGGTITAQS